MRRRFFLNAIPFLTVGRVAGTIGAGALDPPDRQISDSVTDCHHHIYDGRFPPDPKATLRPPDATVSDYATLAKELGIKRHVVVQPSTYGIDNSCLLDALQRFGMARARGIAVVNSAVADSELRRLHAAGVRGIRFNLVQAGATTPDMIPPLAESVAGLGWHIQVNASAEQIVALSDTWNQLSAPIVFDHFGHVSDLQHPAFALICKLMKARKAWTKLSGAETISKSGPPSYGDMAPIAKAFVQQALDQLLWGTNWPFPTSEVKPDAAVLLDAFRQWIPDEGPRRKILKTNPARLYGFA